MLLSLVIIFGLTTIISLLVIFLLYKAGSRHMHRADYFEEYVLYTRDHVQQTYAHLRTIDDRQIFAKDDEVGVAFTEILDVIQKLNEVVQNEQPEE